MPTPETPCNAFKVLTSEQWAQFERDGVFLGAPVDLADGFIHMSTAEQLDETLIKHFHGQTDLIVAEIRLADFGDDLEWEVSRGGAQFPHLYAALPFTAVVAVVQHR